ncbi:hypothetical protein PLICRDRAFT_37594 [Plicaturopsis crispa FD-325 SS-3]|nr:hypothetical protein PLICRDRAFT_37594 [Plicaturopsis crispa FD-325 SS-3]
MSDQSMSVSDIESGLNALFKARCLALASFSLTIYDWMLMLQDETEYFWTGSWTISRILYFANRYFPPCVMILGLTAFFIPNASVTVCDRATRAGFILEIAALAVGQAIIVLRIWHLYSRVRAAQILVCTIFFACTAASLTALGLSFNDFNFEPFPIPVLGCTAPPVHTFWHMYLPTLVLHTALYLFTAVRAFLIPGRLKDTPILLRLLRDNGLIYLVVLLSVGFSVIGAWRTDIPSLNVPAVYSSFTLAITSICTSRIVLSLRSLAADLSLDPQWVLNHAELSRVPWRRGNADGELLVEVDAFEGVDSVVALNGVRTPRIAENVGYSTPSLADNAARRGSPVYNLRALADQRSFEMSNLGSTSTFGYG